MGSPCIKIDLIKIGSSHIDKIMSTWCRITLTNKNVDVECVVNIKPEHLSILTKHEQDDIKCECHSCNGNAMCTICALIKGYQIEVLNESFPFQVNYGIVDDLVSYLEEMDDLDEETDEDEDDVDVDEDEDGDDVDEDKCERK